VTTPYNPLDKLNLARSIEVELLQHPPVSMETLGDINGAGVYAIYYAGDFPAYRPISGADRPIYVGKAIPKGGRKGGLGSNAAVGRSLRDRLSQHASSISQASNVNLSDFSVRQLVVDDIWIPLGENMLIESFRPIWNVVIDGFGNKTPGARRATQYRSPWDVIHPGRSFSEMLASNPIPAEEFLRRIADFFEGRTVPLVSEGDQEE
jgi:hypothetical protein